METLQEKLAKLREVTAMEPQTLTFAFERETKRTVRYQEQPEGSKPPVVGILYVQKAVLGTEPPKTLTVTITAS
jgi:hypothetical protein